MSSNNRKIKCVECGTAFTALNKTARFCTSACRQISHKRKRTCYFCGHVGDEPTTRYLPQLGDLTSCAICNTLLNSITATSTQPHEVLPNLYLLFRFRLGLDKPLHDWIYLPEEQMENYSQFLLDKEKEYARLQRRSMHIQLRRFEYARRKANSPEQGDSEAGRRDEAKAPPSASSEQSGRPDT